MLPTAQFGDYGWNLANLYWNGQRRNGKLVFAAGIADANATAGSFDYSGIFDEGELFSHLELGWTPAYVRRFVDNIHVTAWHVDKRDKAQVPKDWGVAFSLTTRIHKSLQPFFRAGFSQGTAATLERSISIGVGIQRGEFNLLGLGLN